LRLHVNAAEVKPFFPDETPEAMTQQSEVYEALRVDLLTCTA